MNDSVIEHCMNYTYLGSLFTSDGSVSSAVEVHAREKMCHALKFVSFLGKKNDAPYYVKRRVFYAVLMSSLLHGCESSFGADMRPIEKLYNWSSKQLLGVKKATSNIVCYAEIGCSSLLDLVKAKQQKFLKSMYSERSHLHDNPLMLVLNIVSEINMTTHRTVNNVVNGEIVEVERNTHNAILQSESSRCMVHKDINPDIRVHDIQKKACYKGTP